MTVATTFHVIGAGMAGLAAAVRLSTWGCRVIVHEASAQAGGRCRSYFDRALGCRIDNGNHLILSGNDGIQRFLTQIGARDSLDGATDVPVFPFFDLRSGDRWRVRPNLGRMPWWIFCRNRRVPGTRAGDYLRVAPLLWAGAADTVSDRLGGTAIYEKLWHPLAVSTLNTEAEHASAALLGRILRETFGRGGAACRPLMPRVGLSESFVDPALITLQRHGAEIRFGDRIRGLEFADGRVTAILGGERTAIGESDSVIVATTAPVAQQLVPGIMAPDQFRAIINAHFRVAVPSGRPSFLGLVGGVAEWVFVKPDVVSVTISAADRLVAQSADDLLPRLWAEVARALDLPSPMPPARLIREKRATFAATPGQLRQRAGTRTAWPNLWLAGDWTATGLPSTIEGAIRSGQRAAELSQLGLKSDAIDQAA